METKLNLTLHQDAFNKTLEDDMHGFLTKSEFLTSTGIATLLTPISLLNPVTTIVFGFIGSITFKIACCPCLQRRRYRRMPPRRQSVELEAEPRNNRICFTEGFWAQTPCQRRILTRIAVYRWLASRRRSGLET